MEQNKFTGPADLPAGVNALKNLRLDAKRLRVSRGLTQEALAERAGLEYKHYQKIESGSWPGVYLETVELLAEALGATMGALLDPPPPNSGPVANLPAGRRPKR